MIKSVINLDYLKVSFLVNSFEVIEKDYFGKDKIKYKKFSNFLTINEFRKDEKYIINDSLFLVSNDNPNLKSKTESMVFTAFINNRLVGYYYCESVNKDLVFFRFDNSIFYGKQDIPTIIKTLEESLHLTYFGISGIDISVNTNHNIYSPLSLIFDQCLNNPYFRNLNKVKISDHKKYGGRTIDDVRYKSVLKRLNMYQIEDSIYFGSKKTGKRINIYNKSMHSNSAQKKYYNSFFGKESTIYRIELSLRNTGKIKINELIQLKQINDLNHLTGLFIKQITPQFTFIDLTKYKYDSNRNKVYEKINLISELNITSTPPKKMNDVERVKLPKRIQNLNKRYFKKLVTDYLTDGHTTKQEIKSWLKTKTLQKGVEIGSTEIQCNNIEIGKLIINKMIQNELKINDYSKIELLLNEIDSITPNNEIIRMINYN